MHSEMKERETEREQVLHIYVNRDRQSKSKMQTERAN